MKKSQKATSFLLCIALFFGVCPVTKAHASSIQPLPFQVFINNKETNINNSILYQGHTYVKLRDVAAATNMDLEF